MFCRCNIRNDNYNRTLCGIWEVSKAHDMQFAYTTALHISQLLVTRLRRNPLLTLPTHPLLYHSVFPLQRQGVVYEFRFAVSTLRTHDYMQVHLAVFESSFTTLKSIFTYTRRIIFSFSSAICLFSHRVLVFIYSVLFSLFWRLVYFSLVAVHFLTVITSVLLSYVHSS